MIVDLQHARDCLRFANSFNRIPILLELDECIDAKAWLTVLGEEWQSCDNIGEYQAEIQSTFAFDLLREDIPAHRALMMTEAEQEALAALPDIVTVWRGCYQNNARGLCWSLSEDVARRFPFMTRYRQDGQALLLKAEVRRDDIFMLKLDRNENEIVTESAKVRSRRKLTPPKD